MKRTMIVLLLMASAALAQQTAPTQQEPMATRDDVMKMLEVMQVEKNTEKTIDAMQKQMESVFDQTLSRVSKDKKHQFTPEERKRMSQDMSKYYLQVRGAYPLSEMIEDMIPAYEKHLTHRDAVAAIAFYQTPEGQHITEALPTIAQEAMAVVMPKMMKRIQPIIDSMQKDATVTAEKIADQDTSAQ